ncbi:MAG: leucine--tRNA ligase [bacterium]|nr:leucine--tRNA ligase [bacterium]
MNNKYKPEIIEKKWQETWKELGIYKTKDLAKKPKFYALDMFPYPSGVGLHVGHPKGYIATDVISRKKILEGCNVLHPMGWDAFGLPTENYAIKNKIHPRIATEKNIETFKNQLEKFGFTYDWDREINTTDPEFYKWTQWIFLKMFERGLAYQSDEPVNWCPSCKTVLANEDLEGGLCERCGTQVVQKKMKQWVLKMTAYADRLLYDLDTENLDWEELIKEQQKNWIGRSEGATIKFEIKNSKLSFDVFTTRLDTIFGCTYCVVAPEHSLIQKFKNEIENYSEVEKYIVQAQNKTEMERTALAKEKTGVELKGVKAVNPFTNEEIPVWVADYVLGFYGTGAVMAVPAHDERDFEFAKKYGLPIKVTIRPTVVSIAGISILGEKAKEKAIAAGYREKEQFLKGEKAFCKDGALINSEKYNSLTSEKAREEMTKWLEEKNIGKKKVNYKMRDWVFSRQRYWGEPIPIIHCAKCGAVGVPEKDLPVKLPEVKSYEPTGTGESPLAKISEWVNVKCPKCGGAAKRETNTMPQWAGSSWYYLRYVDPKNKKALVDKNKEKSWMPVDLYVGGAEHATRHLLYARFWHKFLFDIGVVSTEEPFKKLFHVGLILASDGRKMSKRWGNVINPDDVIREFGADSFRLYEMFMGPFSQSVSWSTKGVVGMRRFLERIWQLNDKCQMTNVKSMSNDKLERLIHKTIKKVGEDIEGFKFNTAISTLMILSNEFEKHEKVPKDHFEKFLILLSPFAPHIAEELWLAVGNKKSIFLFEWPKYDPNLVKEEEIELVMQINGKVKDKIKAAADISENEAKKIALASEKIKKVIEGKEIKKVIFVKGRLINIVI